MLVRRLGDHSIEFSRIEPIEAELLRQVPGTCETHGDSAAEARLFSNPAPQDEQVQADWEELVRPELRHIFLSAREVVEEDIKTLKSRPARFGKMVVPLAHSDSWLNALNQARLVLAARYRFSEQELSQQTLPKSFSKRDLVLLQINFYAAIQERLIEATT